MWKRKRAVCSSVTARSGIPELSRNPMHLCKKPNLSGKFLNDDKQKNTHPGRRLWWSLRRFKTRKIDGAAARVGSDARDPGELFSVYSDAPRSCGGRPRVEHHCQSAAQAAQAAEDVRRHDRSYRSPRTASRGLSR